jgi:hypothetical protein
MSYEMTKLRKEDLSLYYYIKDVALCKFVEEDELVSLEYIPELSTASNDADPDTNTYVYAALTDMVPLPTERGRGWVYFDDVGEAQPGEYCRSQYPVVSGTRVDGVYCLGTPEQSNRITVYDDVTGSGILPSEYMIDYIDGRVITSGTCDPQYISYYWNYVSVVDEWAAIEASDPPVVVIDIHGTDKIGYQIGPGKKVTRKVDLHIFASNTAERNDIVETLYDNLYLRSCPLYEFPTGSVIDYDGTFNGRRYTTDKLATLFDRSVVDYSPVLYFDNVTTRHISLPLLMTRSRDEIMLSDLNAYRSKISFDLVTFTNGNELPNHN